MADEFTPKRARGRPPIDRHDPSVSLHFRIPSKQYDLTLKQADAARLSHADWLRQVIAARLRRP